MRPMAVVEDWEPHDTSWEKGFEHFRDFVNEHKHGRVFANYRSTDGYSLGAWVTHQRYSSNSLSPERKARLDALRFDWDPLTAQWEEGLEHLQAYIKKHGHCRVPQQYKSLDGYKLGAWVLRRRHSKDTLSPKQIEVLDKLGFDWDPRTRHWEEGLYYLKIYKEREGHCRVPKDYKENGFALGEWVGNQRSKKEETMTEERRQRLDKLGFVWKVRQPLD